MKYLIKISPEISVKSRPVRKRTVSLLKNNIDKHFIFNGIKVTTYWSWDIIYLEYKEKIAQNKMDEIRNEISNILGKIPWINSFMEILHYSLESYTSKKEIFNKIAEETKKNHTSTIEWKSFVVRVKRTGEHNYSSTEIESYVGWELLAAAKNSHVSLKNAEKTIKLEIRNSDCYIIKQESLWINGYPVCFQERVLSLISGWFDSWVSTYSMMKRGCMVDYLFFNLGWNAHKLWVKQVAHYLWKTFSIPHKKARFITIDFEPIMQELVSSVHYKYRWIVLKRLMLKVASKIAEEKYYAIIKGDSLGQVSSQTLKNLQIIDEASNSLVLRPLIGHNKQEIIDISMSIGTYNFATSMPEYCGIISKKPSAWAQLFKILEEEKNLNSEVIKNIHTKKEIEFVKDIPKNNTFQSNNPIEKVNTVQEGEIIIDVREPHNIKKKPLILKEVNISSLQVSTIPFYQINTTFPKLDQNKHYLFYCEKWILSELHWLYLQEKWFNNIKVFRPS